MRILGFAIVVLAALLPIAPILVCAILITFLGVVAPEVTARLARIDDPSDAQPVALLALSHFRAPPATFV